MSDTRIDPAAPLRSQHSPRPSRKSAPPWRDYLKRFPLSVIYQVTAVLEKR